MELYQDVKTFVCKLRLQCLTYDKPAKLPIPFKPKFKVNPTTTVNHTLETFIEKTKVELMSLDLKQNVKDNLTKNERIVLSNLTQCTDIVINKADYIHRGMNHLADEAMLSLHKRIFILTIVFLTRIATVDTRIVPCDSHLWASQCMHME